MRPLPPLVPPGFQAPLAAAVPSGFLGWADGFGGGLGRSRAGSDRNYWALARSVCATAMTPDMIFFFVQCKIPRLMKTALDIMADTRDTEPSLLIPRVIFISLGMVLKIP